MAKPKYEDKRAREILGKLIKNGDDEYCIDCGDEIGVKVISDLIAPFEGFEIAIKLNKEV